jgi:hypothetical protein
MDNKSKKIKFLLYKDIKDRKFIVDIALIEDRVKKNRV